jgi:HEPN domain-containing protein
VRRDNPSDSHRYFDWLFQANLDFLTAKKLYDDERLYPITAFHCQQCIEKALKGYLLFKRNKLYDGHNLTWLCKQASQNEQAFKKWISPSAKLNRYYIETRYPADIPVDINTETINELFEIATDMLEVITREIRFDIAKYRKH